MWSLHTRRWRESACLDSWNDLVLSWKLFNMLWRKSMYHAPECWGVSDLAIHCRLSVTLGLRRRIDLRMLLRKARLSQMGERKRLREGLGRVCLTVGKLGKGGFGWVVLSLLKLTLVLMDHFKKCIHSKVYAYVSKINFYFWNKEGHPWLENMAWVFLYIKVIETLFESSYVFSHLDRKQLRN